ncbi:hypothetical protein CXB51_004548 [Gossypium anomalum]|uniref:Uncharacterized protein n=1 Tax=Gossypium anomalum TaxID=47600 RepID=A0A8J5ZHZ2_9ROSI|nr:hypothetical protein CXB51_004548 [Gossypium anomalum]
MATAIITTTTLLLTCSALLLGFLPTTAHARPFPTEHSVDEFMEMIIRKNIWISTSTETAMEITGNDDGDDKGKVVPSPPVTLTAYSLPSQKLETPCGLGSTCNGLISMVTNFGKTTKSPPSPNPAPSKHQGTIEQPIQQSPLAPDFEFKSVAAAQSPPNPAPSKGQGIIEQPIQQRSSHDFQLASF